MPGCSGKNTGAFSMATSNQTTPTILRRRQVESRVGLSRSTLYQKISRGEFPAPIRLSAQAVGWLSHEVDQWIQARIKSSRMETREVRPFRKPIEEPEAQGGEA
jgi:prophage regulatory protein